MWIIIVIVFFIALFYESLNTPSQDKKKKLPYDSQSVYRPGEHLAQLEAEKRQRNNMPIDRQATKVSHIPQAPTLKFTWDKGFRSKEDEIDADVMPVFDVTNLDKGTRYQFRTAPNSPQVKIAYSHLSERCILGFLTDSLMSTDALRIGLKYVDWCTSTSEPVFVVAWVKNGQGVLKPGLYVRVAEHIHAIVDEHSPTFQTRPPQPNVYQSSVENTTTVPPRQEESYGEKSKKTTKPGQSQRVSIPLRKWEPPIELLGLPRKLAHLVEKQPPVSNQQQKQPAVSTQQKGEDNYRSLYFGD